MIDTQMSKGIIDMVVLEIIRREDTYGYKIVEELKFYGFYSISEGTIYPILQRLLKKNLILGIYKKSKIGPRRKYYYITQNGIEYLNRFKTNWQDMINAVEKVFKR
ncbi:MAG: PadR family transcriptional regulator [Tissierellia bacterium]|nr:PadR family transcriptional regulator [Tissierellia bacterium]